MTASRMILIYALLWLFVALIIATPVRAGAPTPTVFAVFYWWYPFYGAHSRDGAPRDVDGHVDFAPFYQQPLYAVPYLFSDERPDGRQSGPALVAWYASNFRRMAEVGIDVAIIPMRPDLPLWHESISAMAEAQRLTNGRVKVAFMVDGIEYYALLVTEAVIDSYHAALHYELETFYHLKRAVVFVYRPEISDAPFHSTDAWLDTLRTRFRQRFGRVLYTVLDAAWCGGRYGGRVLSTCNADNYWQWGANDLAKAGETVFSKTPAILSVRPAFAEYWGNGRRVVDEDGSAFRQQLEEASTQAQWIVVETWNFWEEGSGVDASVQYGALFLDILKNWSSR